MPRFRRSSPKSYEEAVACAGSGAFTACAIMCRRTLEGICDSHGIVAGNLDGKLKKLRDDEVIERRLFEWADSLRLVGNEAAHDVEPRFPRRTHGTFSTSLGRWLNTSSRSPRTSKSSRSGGRREGRRSNDAGTTSSAPRVPSC